ncbi:hypothetical protein [Bacillus cereus]|uniref:hypothetical protein n=1 Tax=Bacillus cereus TaxID=1396 RepID=UPI0021130ED3|nr:hypothetical protein [Bacillus cereus]
MNQNVAKHIFDCITCKCYHIIKIETYSFQIFSLKEIPQQNQVKNKVKQKKPKTNINADKKEKRDWKYPAKMK